MSADLPPDHPFSGPDVPSRMAAALNEPDGDLTPRRAALRRLAAETRRAIDESMSTAADDASIVEAAQLMARVSTLLARQPHGRPYEGAAEASVGGDPRGFVDYSPIVGPANPVAPPLRVEVRAGTVIATGTFGDAYEGPPGCVHGGFIAASFDEVLGFAQSMSGRPGMTGRLTVAYRSPTPLHRPLRFEGRVDRVDGRKIFTSASLHQDGVLCAEAEGLFISVDSAVFAALNERRRSGGDATRV